MFLTHYGTEYHCTLSQIKVFGETMLVDFRNDLKKHLNDDDLLHEKPQKNLSSTSNKTRIHVRNITREKELLNKSLETAEKINFKHFCDKNKYFQIFKSRKLLKNLKIQKNLINFNKEHEKCHRKSKETIKFFKKPKIFNRTCPKTLISDNPHVSENVLIPEPSNDLDLGIESIFKVLIKHIKELKMNQFVWQDLILKQELFNSQILTFSEILNKKALKIMESNENFTMQLDVEKQRNEELNEKIENLTVFVKSLHEKIHADSDFFIWKVLIISMISSLAFLIFGFCILNTSKDSKEIESPVGFAIKIENLHRKRSHSLENEKMTSKVKKIKQKNKRKDGNYDRFAKNEARSSSVSASEKEEKR